MPAYQQATDCTVDMDRQAWDLWQTVRAQNPLVQCITNFPSQDLMANVLLASGASPAMVHSTEEVEDFSKLISALLINVGTLSPDWVEGMELAGMHMRTQCCAASQHTLTLVLWQRKQRARTPSPGCSILSQPALRRFAARQVPRLAAKHTH